MNEKIERTLRKWQYRIEGNGILLVLQYQPSSILSGSIERLKR